MNRLFTLALLFVALLFIVGGCAARGQDEASDVAYHETPAAVRIAFEKDHPTADVESVQKRVYPTRAAVWEIEYEENGQRRETRYRSDGIKASD